MKREIPFTICITLLLAAFGFYAGRINFIMGVVFWILFILYMIYLIFMSKSDSYKSDISVNDTDEPEKKLGMLVLYTVIGCIGIILGSDLAVDSATSLARIFGISERFIGLTIIAFGTSLPELVTSIAAALKHKADIAIGNIVGSNIFNILFVTGTTALITPVAFERGFVLDTLIAAAAMLLLLISLLKTKSIRRPWGIIMLLCYGAYFAFISI
jgi:cation:H+ antiporter